MRSLAKFLKVAVKDTKATKLCTKVSLIRIYKLDSLTKNITRKL